MQYVGRIDSFLCSQNRKLSNRKRSPPGSKQLSLTGCDRAFVSRLSFCLNRVVSSYDLNYGNVTETTYIFGE